MNFDNEKFSTVLNKINPTKLLLLDFGKFEKEKYSYICQDFDESFYQALNLLKERLANYHQLVFLFPKSLKHPQSSKEYFTRFCQEQGFLCEVQEDIENLTIRKGVAYIAIKQQDVVKVVKEIYVGTKREGLLCYVWGYGYDAEGRLSTITTMNGRQDTIGIVTAIYDTDGKVQKKK